MTNYTNATDKRTALRLLANGDATVAEAARLVGVSHQAVWQWARAAGIDAVERRQATLERLWQDEREGLIAAAHGHVPAPATRPMPKRKRPK